MDTKKGKRIKIVIAVLAVSLGLSLLALMGTLIHHLFAKNIPTSIVIPENIISPEDEADTESESTSDVTANNSQASEATEAESKPIFPAPIQGETTATALRLHMKNPGDSIPFHAVNMFPGDKQTKYYCIQVAHKGAVTVRFRVDIKPGYEILAEVLKTKMVLKNTGEILYDGLMRDMPDSIQHTLKTVKSTVNELYYEITVYLETSVGNEYMEKGLKADFKWWVEETENLDSPQTGDHANLMIWFTVMSVSLGAVILLTVGHKIEVAQNADR